MCSIAENATTTDYKLSWDVSPTCIPLARALFVYQTYIRVFSTTNTFIFPNTYEYQHISSSKKTHYLFTTPNQRNNNKQNCFEQEKMTKNNIYWAYLYTYIMDTHILPLFIRKNPNSWNIKCTLLPYVMHYNIGHAFPTTNKPMALALIYANECALTG